MRSTGVAVAHPVAAGVVPHPVGEGGHQPHPKAAIRRQDEIGAAADEDPMALAGEG